MAEMRKLTNSMRSKFNACHRAYKIAYVAVMAAIVCIATFLRFPLGQSKVHLGNTMGLLSGLLLGPVWGGVAAGLGSALNDVVSGYGLDEILVTFVSKFLMALLCALLAGKGENRGRMILGCAFGALGYECDVRGLPSAEKQAIREQIALYKKWREVMQFGDFYRITEGNLHRWTCVSPDKSRAVVLLLQELTEANVQAHRLQLRGLDPDKTYRLYNIPGRVDVKVFGSLINTVTPVHVRQDSVLHNVIAKQVKMNGETENVTATGSVLMHTGVMLSPAFSGSGFNEKVRIFPDFAARLYFLEAEE